MVSSTEGSRTITGWKRRSSAGSFSMCLRYSSSVVAPTQRSSPRASAGFSMLAASTAPSAAPAPTSVCSSSMKQMISPSDSVISLSTAFRRSSNSPRYLEPATMAPMSSATRRLSLQPLGHVAGHDALGQALDDGGLAHAGLADQHRVVLGAAREHLDHAADLLVAADDRIELALAGRVGEVARVALERLVLVLGILVGHALGAAHLDERLVDRLRRHARRGERAPGRAVAVLGDGDQQVLGGDVLVLEPLGLAAARARARARRRSPRYCAAAAAHLGQLARARPRAALDSASGARAELGEERAHHALLLLEQRQQQVLGLDGLVLVLVGQRLRGLDRFLRLDRQLVQSHRRSTLARSRCAVTRCGAPSVFRRAPSRRA